MQEAQLSSKHYSQSEVQYVWHSTMYYKCTNHSTCISLGIHSFFPLFFGKELVCDSLGNDPKWKKCQKNLGMRGVVRLVLGMVGFLGGRREGGVYFSLSELFHKRHWCIKSKYSFICKLGLPFHITSYFLSSPGLKLNTKNCSWHFKFSKKHVKIQTHHNVCTHIFYRFNCNVINLCWPP